MTPPPDPLPASGEGEFGYPLYDGHGNSRAIPTKNGTSYCTGNWRTYDVCAAIPTPSLFASLTVLPLQGEEFRGETAESTPT